MTQRIDTTHFRGGFISFMRAVQNNKRADAMRAYDDHTASWQQGFLAAGAHFSGRVTTQTELAADLGLTAEYEGFYGQSDFAHPNP